MMEVDVGNNGKVRFDDTKMKSYTVSKWISDSCNENYHSSQQVRLEENMSQVAPCNTRPNVVYLIRNILGALKTEKDFGKGCKLMMKHIGLSKEGGNASVECYHYYKTLGLLSQYPKIAMESKKMKPFFLELFDYVHRITEDYFSSLSKIQKANIYLWVASTSVYIRFALQPMILENFELTLEQMMVALENRKNASLQDGVSEDLACERIFASLESISSSTFANVFSCKQKVKIADLLKQACADSTIAFFKENQRKILQDRLRNNFVAHLKE